ncbi:MAG: hypothetical protein MUE98_02535 [Rhodobacteraceae bacterium]|jgi:hypothetical protein|nr:hypothetical protein [Paracoccaceae bacterium]
MVAPAIPLIYWGIGILLAGGAYATARRIQEEETGRVELPDSIRRLLDPEPEPEREPELQRRPPPIPPPYHREREVEARRRCEDDPEQDCEMCKPLKEGRSTLPRHRFQGGPVRKPSPRARSALYQHFVAGWHHFEAAEDDAGNLDVRIEEWNWRRGDEGSWDALVYSECKLLECKLGYRDFLNEEEPRYDRVNSKKRFLGTLQEAFEDQLTAQHTASRSEWPHVALEWIFSDRAVMWQFVALRTALGFNEVGNRYVPYHLAPDGTTFVGELYSDGAEDYGYWEDN